MGSNLLHKMLHANCYRLSTAWGIDLRTWNAPPDDPNIQLIHSDLQNPMPVLTQTGPFVRRHLQTRQLGMELRWT